MHDIIVLGASAGGIEALVELVARLPADLPAALLIVVHVPAHHTSVLPAILNRHGPLPAAHARAGERIRPGHIYVAPPDQHLILGGGRLRLVRGPHENGHRPAIDPLFRSAAHEFRERVVGVVLSGSLDDGTAGLNAVKRHGGVTIVQDPASALYDSMPRSAIAGAPIDHILTVSEIAVTLGRLAADHVEPRKEAAVTSETSESNEPVPDLELNAIPSGVETGRPSGFTCPSCHGGLWESWEGDVLNFRCRIGHAFSAGSLVAAQSDGLETALWEGVRALEEIAALRHRLAGRLGKHTGGYSARRFEQQAEEALRAATILRAMLTDSALVGISDAHDDLSVAEARAETS